MSNLPNDCKHSHKKWKEETFFSPSVSYDYIVNKVHLISLMILQLKSQFSNIFFIKVN